MPGYKEKEMELNKYRKQRKRKKRRTGFVVFMFLLVSGGVVGTLFFAPFFNVTEVYCVNNNRLSADEVIGSAGVAVGENIFRTSITKMKAGVASVPYVKESNVRRDFPNKIKIWVREGEPMAVVAADGIFLVIDEKGKVLEVIDSTDKYKIPVIHGLDVTKYVPGSKLEVANTRSIDVAIECLNEVINNGMLTDIISIDVSNLSEIMLNYQSRININLSNSSKIAYKVKFFKNIIDTGRITAHEQGIMDFTVENPYFRQTD